MRVLLEESVAVSRPFETVRGRFSGDTSWFTPLATAAEEDGTALLTRVGPSWVGGRLAREVRVSLGQPHERGDALVVPILWASTELSRFFPILNGDILLMPLGAERCRVVLLASYDPPFGELGRQLDSALMRRVAISTARSVLSWVAENLEENTSVVDAAQL
jgi:hypothetical protein